MAESATGSLLAHLIELRRRLMIVVVVVLVVFAALMPIANRLFTWLAVPLTKALPAGTTMIATEVASPLFTPFKLAFVTAVFITIPVLLYQAWAFIAPGLYRHERRMVFPLLLSSTLLFYTGMAFAYFIVFPIIFAFFTSVAPQGVTVMTDINNFLDFTLTLFFAFGLVFEIPVASVLLVWTGVTTPAAMGKARPYVLLGAFVVGMLLTPPDILSQTLLAVPMYMLYESGIIFARILVPGAREVEAQRGQR
ncbi:MAG: twin-arginine translocase subunit TatC [Gammaproteobacteria bacterium]|jgi:sec-independent protein translocase protein TatC